MELITLKKIAQILELSISTVSRALKDHPDISKTTKKRVNELAETLDYEPNINAINLRTKNSRVIGLIVPSISGFFYDSFISAVEKECRKNKFSLMILQSGRDIEIEKNNIKYCRQNRVSGLFVCLTTKTIDLEVFEKFEESEIPIVFFDKVPESFKYNKVCINDEQSAILAAEAIITKEKRKVLALFGNQTLSITQKRLKAFENTFSKYDGVVIYKFCDSSIDAKNITTEIFAKKNKPDSIFCMSDEVLIGVVKSLGELKLKIPNDAAVIALSDGYLPKLYTPEIDYIETSGYKLGKLAFSKMLDCFEGNKKIETLYTTSHLVVGGSL